MSTQNTTGTGCPHAPCGCSTANQHQLSTLSAGESIARFFRELLRLLQVVGALLKTANKTLRVNFIALYDPQSAVWNPALIQQLMKQVQDFYKRHKIEISYTIAQRAGLRSVESEQRLRPTGEHKNLFFVDQFSDCDNCTLRGYEYNKNVVVRYYEAAKQPSSYLWTTIAHEIGHALNLPHGGSLDNLMHEMGPSSDQVSKVKLTICQVAKMKQ